MAAGRAFAPEDDRLESPAAVAVLSHGYWQREFGGDPAIPGRTIRLEDVPFTVVGVAPATFSGTSSERIDIWMPIASAGLLRPDDRWVMNVAQKPESCCMALAGRLAPGVTREQAQADLTIIDRQFREERNTDAGGIRVVGTQHNAGVMQGGSPAFAPIFGGVILVLALSCANVGNLLIARAAARRREIGVRLSLGASRRRVIRQLFTESLALATLAGAAGLLLAAWLARAFDQWSGLSGLRFQHDVPVLGYTLALTVISCIVFGLAPALHGTRATIGTALKDEGAMGSPRLPLRNLLMAAQVAIAVVLLDSQIDFREFLHGVEIMRPRHEKMRRQDLGEDRAGDGQRRQAGAAPSSLVLQPRVCEPGEHDVSLTAGQRPAFEVIEPSSSFSS